MTGKEKCELLKTIRKRIAEMNGIEYYPEQCDHVGNCPGFCPRCDMEASYLMKELKKMEAAGTPIRVDTESLGNFETLVGTPVDSEEQDILMGIPLPPELPELGGDIMPLKEDDFLEDIIIDENNLQGDILIDGDFDDNEDDKDNENETKS